MNLGASIVAALGASVAFALAAILQQESTQEVPTDKSLTLGLLFALLRRPRWVAGVGLLLVGFGLQALALAFGPVALVQPIVAIELALAIPLGIWRHHHRAGQREWSGIVSVVAGISLFLLIASPSSGTPDPEGAKWLAALVPAAAVAAAAIVSGARNHGRRRAMLLGAAAGITFGTMSVILKSTTFLLGADVSRAFTSWQLYTVVAVGIVALVVSQSAYQAGPLAYSMPFVGVLEPLVAVVIGDTVLGEQVRLSASLFAAQLVAAAIACLGIVLLTTSPTVLSVYEEGARRRE